PRAEHPFAPRLGGQLGANQILAAFTLAPVQAVLRDLGGNGGQLPHLAAFHLLAIHSHSTSARASIRWTIDDPIDLLGWQKIAELPFVPGLRAALSLASAPVSSRRRR